MSSRMKLDEIRRARGYSQEYMANKLGCHRNTYARMEEKPQNITMEEADKLATILNVSVNELELVDQEGNYVDYIKMSCLFNGKYELFQKTNKRSEKYVKR